ncbi:Undecaprenyl-diphosphatase [bioreactor metagenome]|uniref:Undecaprenyl-diphosphatase n=1 Tax=bioreactor metagenome TaxID=1076179 RepID=A0A644T6W9_9ZZZZ|nr:undecaprenyl-diphosphatase UppP [Candidatus Elulimicrobiales bacterium]
MNIIHSIILGLVEGITEFLPISSTGHLILTSYLLKLPSTEALKSFLIVIQLGAILAVLVLYIKELFNLETIKKLIIAFIPTGLIGLTLYKLVKGYLMDNILVVIISLLLGGIAMILIERNYIKKNKYTHPEFDKKLIDNKNKDLNIKEISYKKAFFLGLWQSVAMIPGVSRSGATVIGGLLMNLKRETIVKFSFLLAIPTMLGASVLDLYKSYQHFSSADILNISIGFIVSFVFALIFIKWLLSYIQKHNFIPFGWYRIILALVFFLVFFIIS